MGFDNTIDNRWRPDFESSWQRVREETEPRVFSRELSVVPSQRRTEFEPHDAQTRAIIAEHKRLEQLLHGEAVVPRLEEWRWKERMSSAAEKQTYLEPLIRSVHRDPVGNQDVLLFLLLVFEPIRRSVSSEFMRARSGLGGPQNIDWTNKSEARMIREIDRQTLYDVTRNGVLEALFRYPTPGPDMLFPWMRETISWRALDVLRADLAEIETTVANRAEAEAIQAEIAGFDQEPPALADGAGLRAWQRRVPLRDLYEAVEEFYREDGVRKACRAAIGRLASRAPREAEVIEGIFYEERTPTQLAVARGVKRSTIDNAKSHATRHLGEDDSFFYALHRFGIVRDRARATSLVDRYPSGRLPDGRRIVSIAEAA